MFELKITQRASDLTQLSQRQISQHYKNQTSLQKYSSYDSNSDNNKKESNTERLRRRLNKNIEAVKKKQPQLSMIQTN